MMKVHDRFIRLHSNRGARVPLRGTETVQTEQVPVLGEHNVFLEFVTPNRTEVAEICSSPDPVDLLAVVRLLFDSVRVPPGVNRSRLLVQPVGDRTREENGDDQTDEHLDPEENEAEKECIIFPGRESPNEGDVCHALVVAEVRRSERGSGEEWKRMKGGGGVGNERHHRRVAHVRS